MKIKRITSLLLITVTMMTLVPRNSYAFLGIGDVVSDPGNQVVNTITSINEVQTIVKTYGLDTLAYNLAKLAGTKISNKVFNKATGGGSGDSSQPSYIKNFTSYFSDLQMGQIDKFVTDLSVSRNPFAQDIAQGLVQGTSNSGSGLNQFNLDQVIGSNYKDFANDANVGGWDGFLALSNPANTNIGSALIAKQELANQIQNATDIEKIKLTSSGTTPQGKCDLSFGDYKNAISNSLSGLGSNSSTNTPRASGIDSALGGTTVSGGNTNGSGNPVADGGNQNQQNYMASQNGNTSGVDVSGLTEDYGGCLSQLIQNPVGLVTSGLSKAIDTATDVTTAADSLQEVLVGMLTSMVGNFLKGGLAALNADFSQPRSPVGGPEQLVAKNGQIVPWTATPNIIVDLPADLQGSIDQTEKEVSLLNSYVSSLSERTDGQGNYADAVVQLDQCIPGPDYRFTVRLGAYFSKQNNAMKRQGSGDKAKADFQTTKDIIDASEPLALTDMSLWAQDPKRNIPGAGVMLQQVAELKNIRTAYQQKKTDIIQKQSALNLLYKIEGELKSNIQELKNYMPANAPLPANVPFTNSGWNKLTTTEQTTLTNWAKTISGQAVPTGADAKRNFVQSVIWNIWSNPDQYIIDPHWDGTQFLKDKNSIRSDYNSIQNIVSTPYSLNQAEVTLKQLQSTIETTHQMAADCQTMRDIIKANHFLGPDAHTKLLAVLKADKGQFKTDSIQQALDTTSILSTDPGSYPESVNCKNFGDRGWSPNPTDWIDRSHGTGKCQQDAGITDTDAEDGGTISYDGDNEYQTQPATDIWMVLDQDTAQQLFCGFNRFLGDFPTHGTNAKSKGQLFCANLSSNMTSGWFSGLPPGIQNIVDPAEEGPWYYAHKSDVVGYLYGDSVN